MTILRDKEQFSQNSFKNGPLSKFTCSSGLLLMLSTPLPSVNTAQKVVTVIFKYSLWSYFPKCTSATICYAQGLAQHLQVETWTRSAIRTIRRAARSPTEGIYTVRRNFQYVPTLLRLSIYHFPDTSAVDCMHINLLKWPQFNLHIM